MPACAILAMMKEKDWIQRAKAQGWQDTLHTLLDIVEPIGPLAAQVLWVIQPVSRVLGADRAIHDLANALEEPEGIEQLRQRLDD